MTLLPGRDFGVPPPHNPVTPQLAGPGELRVAAERSACLLISIHLLVSSPGSLLANVPRRGGHPCRRSTLVPELFITKQPTRTGRPVVRARVHDGRSIMATWPVSDSPVARCIASPGRWCASCRWLPWRRQTIGVAGRVADVLRRARAQGRWSARHRRGHPVSRGPLSRTGLVLVLTSCDAFRNTLPPPTSTGDPGREIGHPVPSDPGDAAPAA